jgi:very-short-patch-repair endonuclease
MSFDSKSKLTPIAHDVSRQLRKSSTKAERLFWERVRNKRFLDLKFRRQHPLFVDDYGRDTFCVVDFYCHEKRLVVELDGGIHENQKKQDAERDELMRENGLRVKRFTNEEVEGNIEKVMKELETFMEVFCK